MGSLAGTLLPPAAIPAIRVEFPLGDMARCAVIHDFLTPNECDALVAATEQRGFVSAGTDYPPSYRDNDRIVADDPALALLLFERLTQCAARAPGLASVMDESSWRMVGVNERLRFCRYRPGTQFRAHQDGVHHRRDAQSQLTFMVYLNDETFTGGDTVFFADRSAAVSGREATLRLRPRKGSLIVFDHALWHAGAVVDSGTKYVMRSDLMYEPAHSQPESGPFAPGHLGYVWCLAALSDGTLASAGRDATLRLWNREGLPLGQLEGHTQSILGLVETAPGEIVSHSRDRSLRHWSLATGESTVVGTSESAVLSAACLDGKRIVTGDADGFITVWNLATGHSNRLAAHGAWVWAIAALGDAGFATASEDGTIKVWGHDSETPSQVIEIGCPLRTLGSCIDQDGRAFAAAGDVEGRLHLLAVEGTSHARLGCIAAHDGPVRRVRLESRDDVLTCGEDGLVMRWQVPTRTGKVIGRHDNFATDVIPMGPGRWISCGYDGRIRAHADQP